MKRLVSVFLAAAILISIFVNYPVYVQAAGGNAIAIMVEQNSFDNSNVGGDGENTLLWKKGNATLNGGQLLLTNNSWQAGSVVKRNQVKLSDGFSTYFQMYFSGNADGVAFVLYKSDTPKLGENGGALGYGDKEYEYYGSDPAIKDEIDNAIHDSIIVEFDTWDNYGVNADQYDLNDAGYNNHVAIMLDGNQAHVQQSDGGAAVYTNAGLSGQTINAWVDYDSGNGTDTTGTLTVTFGTGATKDDAANHTISRTIQVSDNTPIAGDSVFAGFTSSTGGNATTHKLLKWYFKDSYVAGGLDPTAGTYTQAPATLSVVPNNAGTNPTSADITIKDASGNAMPNETFTVYIDDISIPEGTPGDYNTGAGAAYSFTIPSDLSNGSHTIRVIGEGGVTNFAAFTVAPSSPTYPVGLALGNATLTGGKYYYSAANVTGNAIRTILISFSKNVTDGDEIVLPTALTGFTVSSSSNDYTKRINLDSGVSTSDIQDYLRGVGFAIAGASQMVSVTVTTENITTDTFYNIDTEHYYQYIPSTTTTWTDAYADAQSRTYMGRTGYLATVMSEDEDTYLNSLSGGKTGWLGGTILKHSEATTSDGLHYSSFDTTGVVTGWYWSCGPEIGTTFYDTNSLYPGGANASNAANVDANNTAYYYNWARGTVSYEPNNRTGDLSYLSNDYETCLTTLEVANNTGKHGTAFSWNDKHYAAAGTDTWEAKGYFIEYGDKLKGDNGSGSTAFASDSSTLTVDSTPPASPTYSPANGMTDVSVSVTPTLTFGEALYGDASGTVTGASPTGVIKVFEGTSNTGAALTEGDTADNSHFTVAYNSTTHVFTVTFGASLKNSQSYYVELQANKVYDTAGNAIDTAEGVTFTTAAADTTDQSNDASLISVLSKTDSTPGSQTGTDTADAIAWEISVSNSKSTLSLSDIVVTTGASLNLYTDSDFSTEVTTSDTLALKAGDKTAAYIMVTAQDGATVKYYTVTIKRATASSGGGGSGSSSASTSTKVTGNVIDSHTGESVKGIEAQVTEETNGTKTLTVESEQALLIKEPDGSETSFENTSKISFSAIGNTNASISFSANGTIKIKNLAAGTESKFAVAFDLGNGQKITLGTINVKVGTTGEVSLTSTLIDPYGIITDSATGKPIAGANVTLYYADTDKNKAAGKTPDTIVALPVLDTFKPNNNKNPQTSTESGEYAFMVFPDSDYYIVAAKEGYEQYKSPLICVAEDIVKWDFKMNKSLNGLKRLSGSNRVDTALEIAKANYTGQVSNVVLATAANYPDSLTGSVLAYKLNAPILLVGKSAEDQEKILDYMKSNLNSVGTVYILGETGAIDSKAEEKIKAAGFSKITRIGGADRYETALKIAEYLDVPQGRPIVLAYGGDYPDALSVGSVAAAIQSPIILVRKDGMSDAVKEKIAEIKPIKVYIIGLQGIISTEVENLVARITSLDKANIVRIGGEDRYQTSLAVVKYFNLSGQSVCLATGNNFPDALAGNVYAANYNAPLILADKNLSEKTIEYLKSRNMTGATIFGGEGAVNKTIGDVLLQIIRK